MLNANFISLAKIYIADSSICQVRDRNIRQVRLQLLTVSVTKVAQNPQFSNKIALPILYIGNIYPFKRVPDF